MTEEAILLWLLATLSEYYLPAGHSSNYRRQHGGFNNSALFFVLIFNLQEVGFLCQVRFFITGYPIKSHDMKWIRRSEPNHVLVCQNAGPF